MHSSAVGELRLERTTSSRISLQHSMETGMAPATVEEAKGDGDHPWEERTLDLLVDSHLDQGLSCGKSRKRKHKLRWMKRARAIPDVILDFFHHDIRECALRALSTFLLERRKEDPDNYDRAAFLVLNSCATMCILLQEVMEFYKRMVHGTLNPRLLKRIANVLTIFQSIAANPETRPKFIDYHIPSYLIPIIFFQSIEESFDSIRAIALSVIGILCQGRETKSIVWALESDIVKVCCTVMKIGNELSKVIAMHILESILLNEFGMVYMCHPFNEKKLRLLTETWSQMVVCLADKHDFSPRLLFHIIRCYAILCTHPRGLAVTVKCLPHDIINNSFHEIIEEFPIIRNLLDQLLVCVGKYSDNSIAQENFDCYEVDKMSSSKSGIDCNVTNRFDFLAVHDQFLNRVIFVPVSLIT